MLSSVRAIASLLFGFGLNLRTQWLAFIKGYQRVVWSYGCILWTCFGAALGSWLAPLRRHLGVGWADEGRDVSLAGCVS